MRCIHEYLKTSWWVTPNSTYYGTFFPRWNGAFECKPSVLLSLPCPADQPGAHQAQPVWRTPVSPGPGMEQAAVSTTNMAGIFINLYFPKPWGKSWSIFQQHPCITVCMSNILVGFEADCPMLGLILLPLNQAQSSTPHRQRQKHPVNLQLSVVFSKSFTKLFILQLFPTKKG